MDGFTMSRYQQLLQDPQTLDKLSESPVDPWLVMKNQFPTVGQYSQGQAQAPAFEGLAGTPAGPRTYGTSAPINPDVYAPSGVPQPANIGGALGVGAQGLSMIGQAQQRTPPAPAHLMNVGESRKQTFRPWLRTPTPASQPGIGELLMKRRNG